MVAAERCVARLWQKLLLSVAPVALVAHVAHVVLVVLTLPLLSNRKLDFWDRETALNCTGFYWIRWHYMGLDHFNPKPADLFSGLFLLWEDDKIRWMTMLIYIILLYTTLCYTILHYMHYNVKYTIIHYNTLQIHYTTIRRLWDNHQTTIRQSGP